MPRVNRVLIVACLVALPSAAYAQATLAGVVRDTSGAVLPGVSVEATSPVLIEKVRAAVTDGNGQYQIVNLLPGTYGLTFSLSGFNAVKREGVEVTGSGVITISAEMRVGAVTETITVTGESPIVDIQSTRRQTVLNAETVNAIPAARGFGNLLASLPGVQITMTNPASPFNPWYTAHGGRGNEGRVQLGGLNAGGAVGGGGTTGFAYDIANSQEIQVTLSGGLGESDTGGPVMNIVPKEGGNRFAGSVFASTAGEWSQGENLDDELRAFGITDPAALIKNYDYSGALGGPIVRDRLWFFATVRTYGNEADVPGLYGNRNAGDPSFWNYVRDDALKVRGASSKKIVATRITSQLTPRNKVGFYHDYNLACNGSSFSRDGGNQCRTRGDDWIALGSLGFGNSAPESASLWDDREKIIQATWTSPFNNRLLLEAGYSTFISLFGGQDPVGSRPDLIAVTEQFATPATGVPVGNFTYRGLDMRNLIEQQPHAWRAAASYVTGTHNVKVGVQGAYNTSKTTAIVGDSQLAYRFGNGIPNQFTMRLGPREQSNRSNYYALYAQDSWTVARFTLQGALRYEHATSFFPAEGNGIAVATRFSPAPISFGRLDGVTGYNDISPRAGVAWDVFGNGRTAVKVNLGHYLEPVTNDGNYTIGNKAAQLQVSTARAWTDSNSNYTPDCNLMNPVAQNLAASGGDICGPWANLNFGNTVNPITVNPDVLSGWRIRPYDWQFGASIQQEILPRLSAEVAYNRRWFGNFFVTDNLAIGAANYDVMTYSVPSDSRLPDGGGYQTSFMIQKDAGFGQTDNYYTFESDYGDSKRYWHGVDLDLRARLRNGLVLQGGASTGRGIRNTCEITEDVPELLVTPLTLVNQQISSCDVREDWLTTIRGLATYTVPKIDVLVSAILRSEVNAAVAASGTTVATNGASLAANFNMPNATAQQLLGRPLAGGAQNTTLNLIRPGEFFPEKRLNNVDIRFAKVLRFADTRADIGIDLYNLFNANTPTSYDQVYGANWLRPTGVKIPRFVRFNVTFDF